MSTVHLTTLTDKNYLIPTIVMMASMKENMAQGSHYHFHLFHSDLTPWDEQVVRRLESAQAPHFTISIRQIRPEDNNFSKVPHGKLGQPALKRLNMPHLLPDIEKVLYMDSDILVLKDLTELYETDIGDNLIAGVKDVCLLFQEDPRFGHFPPNSYICTGVMLMNLKQMRLENTEQRFLDVVPEVVKFWVTTDQDIINYACAGRIFHLHPRYDWITETFNWARNSTLEQYNALHNCNYESRRQLEDDCVIVHIAGTKNRPWKTHNAIYSHQWLYYFHKSPVRNWCLRLTAPALPSPTCSATPPSSNSGELHSKLNGVWTMGICKWIPLFTIRSTWDQKTDRVKKRVKLFGLLPLLSGKGNRVRMHWRLFNFLPIWRTNRDA